MCETNKSKQKKKKSNKQTKRISFHLGVWYYLPVASNKTSVSHTFSLQSLETLKGKLKISVLGQGNGEEGWRDPAIRVGYRHMISNLHSKISVTVGLEDSNSIENPTF